MTDVLRRLRCRVVGHVWRWQWRGGQYEHSYCARCGITWDERSR